MVIRVDNASEAKAGDYLIWSEVQGEAKPFATSFVDGVRDEGFLSYPYPFDNIKSFTWVTWWIPMEGCFADAGHNLKYLMSVNDGGTRFNLGKRAFLHFSRDERRLTFTMPDSAVVAEISANPRCVGSYVSTRLRSRQTRSLAIEVSYSGIGTAYVTGIKLEQGTIATAWSPAPGEAYGAGGSVNQLQRDCRQQW